MKLVYLSLLVIVCEFTMCGKPCAILPGCVSAKGTRIPGYSYCGQSILLKKDCCCSALTELASTVTQIATGRVRRQII